MKTGAVKTTGLPDRVAVYLAVAYMLLAATGAEGSTALTQITQRLTDPSIPESRRDVAPICLIKTRLFGALVGSDNRSLKPVGKNHYVARIRLQPGDTTLNIKNRNG